MSLAQFAGGPVEWDPVGPIRIRIPSRPAQRDTLPPATRVRDVYDDPSGIGDYHSPDEKEKRQEGESLFHVWRAENEAMLADMWDEQKEFSPEPYDDWIVGMWRANKADFLATVR